MNYGTILDNASTNTGLDKAQVEKAVPAFLETLSFRLTDNEQHDLASQLPEPLQDTLHPTDPDIKKMSVDQFVSRLAERSGLNQDQARQAADGLWTTVAQAISAGEAGDVKSRLPQSFNDFFRR